MNITKEIDTMSSEEVDKLIREYFSDDEWQELSDSDKVRNRLMFVNFVGHPESAHLTPIPPFLKNSKGQVLLSEIANINKVKKKTRKRKPKVKAKEKDSKEKYVKKLSDNDSSSVRRNPERNTKKAILNYQEEEIPDDDRYIFCDTCQKEVIDYCETCGSLVVVKDVDVPVGVPDRAQKTVPPIFKIRESTVHGLGVFARSRVPQGIQLGPYEGTVTRILNSNGYSWRLRNGKLVDAADESVSNWMRYVNCAQHMSLQNVVAFQYRGELYYRTARAIQPGEELLVYYGNSFARELGIEPKKYFDPQVETQLKQYFMCKHCHVGLSLQKFKESHEKMCRYKKEVYFTGDKFGCRYCTVLFSSEIYKDEHEKWCRKNPNFGNRKKTDIAEIVKRQYECGTSNYQTKRKELYNQHKLVHDKENAPKYTCKICLYTTVHRRYLKTHLRTHNDFRLVCQFCQRSFNQKRNLDNHYLIQHPDKFEKLKSIITNKIKECHKCSYKTIYTSHFKNHILTHETGPDKWKYHCKVCDYKTFRKSSFTAHLRLHVDQLPFLCIECKKRFNRKRQLDGHIVTNHKYNDKLLSTVTNKVHCCTNCIFKTVQFSHFKYHVSKCINH